MAQWVGMGMSMARSTGEIVNGIQGLQQGQQTMTIADDERRIMNMQDRNLLISDIARAGSDSSKTKYVSY